MKLTAILIVVLFSMRLAAQQWQPDWESLDSRPVPQWFSDAKFGIFIHWGPYSVPAWRPPERGSWEGIYAEWYGPDVMYKPWRNDSFHVKNYGPEFVYRDFGPLFRAELWQPESWADLITNSGAKYVVFTTKHSDGFCNWPTKDPVSKGWNSGDTGPERDLTGELTQAIRDKGLKMGFYYSWLEYENMDSTQWPHHPALAAERTGYYIPKKVFDQYTVGDKAYIEHCHFQFKELITNYMPDIVWADATWDRGADYWKSRELLAWIFNHAPNRDSIVVNDRWDNTAKKHGGYITTEYGTGVEGLEQGRPWEECQGIGYSFGYNRAEDIGQYKTSKDLIELLLSTVSRGGNLLLNIGPRADGTIPVIMQERLTDMGRWLKINGEAIYATHPCTPEFVRPVKGTYHFTTKPGVLYLSATEWPKEEIVVKNIIINSLNTVSLLGCDIPVKAKYTRNTLTIFPPALSPDMHQDAWVFKIEGFEKTIEQNQ